VPARFVIPLANVLFPLFATINTFVPILARPPGPPSAPLPVKVYGSALLLTTITDGERVPTMLIVVGPVAESSNCAAAPSANTAGALEASSQLAEVVFQFASTAPVQRSCEIAGPLVSTRSTAAAAVLFETYPP